VVLGTVVVVVVVVAGVGAAVQLTRKVPAPEVVLAVPSSLRTVPSPPGGPIPWPTQGEAAMAVPGVVSFPAVGSGQPVPIASIAKLMTALVLLADHPLSPGEQGPAIPVTAQDVATYNTDLALAESVVPVTAGEQLSELQAIEAMLVPSADNIADLVAAWDAGTEAAFVAKMNAMAQSFGLTSLRFADASGLSAQTVGTATDVMGLGERAMANPVIRSVVAMPSVVLPGLSKPAPTYDFDLFADGIVGIKTGSDGPAGGCFAFAADVTVDGKATLAYGAVLGQTSTPSSLDKAMTVTLGMVKGLDRVLGGVRLLAPAEPVGTLRTTWGGSVPVSTAKGLDLVAAPGERPTLHFVPRSSRPLGDRVAVGTVVGTLRVGVNGATTTLPVVADGSVGGPTLGWRLLRT